MTTLWFYTIWSVSLSCVFVATIAQHRCRQGPNISGTCKPFADCAVLRDRIIFPDRDCESGTICCPDDDTKPAEPKPTNLIILPMAASINTIRPVVTQTSTIAPTHPTAIPEKVRIFDEEFYRRLGLAYGEKYDIYHKLPPTSDNTEDDNILSTTTTPADIPTLPHYEENLHPRGLAILSSQKCGFVYANKNLSAGGEDASILEYPWMALLQYNSRRFACGGSLVTDRWVLTAAHCINADITRVRLGEYEVSENTKRDCVRGNGVNECTQYIDVRISSTIIHQDYQPATGFKDIALIKLKNKVRRNKNIKPICLPFKREFFSAPFDQNVLTIAGWGLTEKGFSSAVLKRNTITQRPRAVCQLAYPDADVNRTMICLGGSNELPANCNGDPGGPVFWLVEDKLPFYTQIGIMPLGMNKCGGEESSSYYAESVAHSMDWITRVIGEAK
ncbi:phenoloxidase-activating factor 3-like [Anastrepha obliqua]|uniref:phenoloxidase-activating factor 3-like n=1 Tax=Anastrepha obliqua TaxID=95512 RepID=UPI00240A77E6|nr:phenoloxidase-activating factor 3-like [Anastrepha obliqua]XP_054734106.1 phenoloxidase-activating factor 3-like [Anastrepha obliqua]